MKTATAFLSLLLSLPMLRAGESRTLIAPTDQEWTEAAANLPASWKASIAARKLPIIRIPRALDDRVYALRSFPDMKDPLNWRIDLNSVIKTYNSLFTAPGGAEVSTTSARNFGIWSTPSEKQRYYFKLQWTFVAQDNTYITVVGFGQSKGASIWKSNASEYRHDMNYAFARSFLLLATHLDKQMPSQPTARVSLAGPPKGANQ